MWGFGSIGRWCRRYFSVRDQRTRWHFTCTALAAVNVRFHPSRSRPHRERIVSMLPDISAVRTSGYMAPNWSGVGMHRRLDDCRALRHSPEYRDWHSWQAILPRRSGRAWSVTQIQGHVAIRVVDILVAILATWSFPHFQRTTARLTAGRRVAAAKVSATPSSNSAASKLPAFVVYDDMSRASPFLESRRNVLEQTSDSGDQMPKVALKTLTVLVVPVVVAITAQTATADKPHDARVRDQVAAHRQLWNNMSSSNNTSLDATTLGNPIGTDPSVRDNDPNVYRDGQPIPYYDINPHGG